MTNQDKILDRAIAESIEFQPVPDATHLENRIIQAASESHQTQLLQPRTRLFPALGMALAACVVLAVSVAFFPILNSPEVPLANETQVIELIELEQLAVDPEQLAALVWDEVLLLEDEQAFAAL